MTTALITGLSYAQAVEAVRCKAVEYANSSGEIGVHTETGNMVVLVGFARNGRHSCVIEIDKHEYANMGGLKVLKIIEANP